MEKKEDTSKKLISQEDIMKLLDSCYEKSLNGIPVVSESISDMANDYLKKHSTKEKACKALIRNQIIKCTTSGFLTGFGGVITMPVTIPANLGSVIYVQMRMIGAVAYIGGYDIKSDQVQTLVYACLAGVSVNKLIKQVGIKIGTKIATNMVKKIPGKVLTKINQKVGFRLVTKFGTKGVVNIGKAIPVVGAVVGGGLDLVETKAISRRAYKWFIEGNFDTEKKNDEVIDVKTDDIEVIENES